MTEQIILDDFEIIVVRSEKRKTVNLEILSDGQILFRVPNTMDFVEIEKLAKKKRGWLREKATEAQIAATKRVAREMVSGETIYLFGKPLVLKFTQMKNKAIIQAEDDFLYVADNQKHRAREIIIDFLSGELLSFLVERKLRFERRLGVGSTEVKVEEIPKKWADCNSKGTLRFHWRCACLPKYHIEYLLAHELTHTLISGHGDDFWRTVNKICPDSESQKKWLLDKGYLYDL